MKIRRSNDGDGLLEESVDPSTPDLVRWSQQTGALSGRT